MFTILRNLLGPVFAKDAVEAGRQTRTYVLRTLLATALLLFFAIAYSEGMRHRSWAGARPSVIARQATDLVGIVLVVQFIAAFVVAPAAVCGALAGERERGTLDLLFTTHLKDHEVVAGKAGARLAIAVLTMLIPMPCLAILGTMGGVSYEQVFWMSAATAGALMVSGGAALYWSSRSATPLRAALMTYMSLALLLVALPFATMMVDEVLAGIRGRRGVPGVSWAMSAQVYFNPNVSVFACVERSFWSRLASRLGENFQWHALLGQFGVLLACGALAARDLRKPVGKPKAFFLWRWIAAPFRYLWWALGVLFAQLTGRAEPAFGKAGSGTWRRDPSRAGFGKLEVANPLWLRGRQAPVYDRERVGAGFQRLMAFFYLCSALMCMTVLATSRRSWRPENFFGGWLFGTAGLAWFGTLLPIALVASLAAVGDRRRGFLDHVLTTDLEPREFFDGTILAVFESLRGVLLAALAPALLGVVCGLLHPGYAALACANYLAAVLTIVVGCVAASYAARGTGGAVAMGVFFAATVVLGGWIFLAEALGRTFAFSTVGGLALIWGVRAARHAGRRGGFGWTCAFLTLAAVIPSGFAAALHGGHREYWIGSMPVPWIFHGFLNAVKWKDTGPFHRSGAADLLWTAHFVQLAIIAGLARWHLLRNFAATVRRSE